MNNLVSKKIRNDLLNLGFDIPQTTAVLLQNELSSRSVNFNHFETTGKVCKIDFKALDDNDFWLFPFVMGVPRNEFALWEKSKIKFVTDFIREKIFAMERDYLSINDRSFIINTP